VPRATHQEPALTLRPIRLESLSPAHRLGWLATEIEDSLALQALSPLAGTFLPWTVASMRPIAILKIVNDIVVNQRRVVVECGSGNSTIFAARAMSQHDISGFIHSIDHHPGWAAVTSRALVRENLQQWASVTCAPLVDGWYDPTLVPDVQDVDMLIVDGPPAHDPEIATAREPALRHFIRTLAPGATILLDDSRRSGERRVLSAWREDYRVKLSHQRGGYAIGVYEGPAAA
jgi:SAM-dependent methyltransferase